MKLGYLCAALAASLMAAGAASAAVLVSPGQSAVAAFNVSGLTPGTITSYGYGCSQPTCDGNQTGDPDNLASGASIQVSFGSTAGASDIASLVFANPFGFDITNFSTSVNIPVGALSTIYLTFSFIDDVFAVDTLFLRLSGGNNMGVTASPLAPIPLPAALPLFLAGLAGLGLTRATRRSSHRAG